MSQTKDRLLRAGEKLFAAQGFSGTGLKQLAREARAPWSSMYHFFPGGKEQLGTDVIAHAAQLYADMIDAAFARGRDPVETVAGIFKAEIENLELSNFRNGCPVAAVALDVASTSEKMRKPCSEAFALWVKAIARGLGSLGLPESTTNELATYVLCSLEGAIVLSRARKSVAPLACTAACVRQTLETACARSRSHKQGLNRAGTRSRKAALV